MVDGICIRAFSLHDHHARLTYRLGLPLLCEVLMMRIWGVPLPNGQVMWQLTALLGPFKLRKQTQLCINLANEWQPRSVEKRKEEILFLKQLGLQGRTSNA